MAFNHIYVEPLRPTSLESREWLPLPASDFSFYPAVNSFTMPEPLDPRRLQISLAQTLQLFPGHAGIVAKNPSSGSWQIRLLNQRVRLSIGKSRNPGPFAKDWKDERHPDYFEELIRANVAKSANNPLFQAKVTTWEATGQTAIMVSQSYCLGDAFSATSFMHCWSNFYQGKVPPVKPTFEKYFLPTTRVPAVAAHPDLDVISWMAADFDEDYHRTRIHKMEQETDRIDLTFSGHFVDYMWNEVKKSSGNTRIGRSDAFAGYLISALQSILDQPVQHAHQFVTVRDREMVLNGKPITLPRSTTGNAYMVWGFPLQPSRDALPSSIATALYQGRRKLTDPVRLGNTYSLYNSFYEKAIGRDRIFVDSGYTDAIAINWLVNPGLNGANFGFQYGVGHIEWESLENFFQVWRANPIRQVDGTWLHDSSGLQVVCRLRKKYVEPFLARLGVDLEASVVPQIQEYNARSVKL